MPWLELLGNDIHYLEAGSGQPVVLIHGKGSGAACWEPIMTALADRYHVFAYDSVNHGFSANTPREDAEPDRADELEAFLAELDIERPILVGQSMGSMTVLRWCVRHPDDAAGLVACGMGWPISLPPLPSALDADEGIWVGVGDSFTPDWIEANPREYQRYIRVRSTATTIEADRHPRRWTFDMPRFIDGDPEMAAGLAKITSPFLFFVGTLEMPAILAGAKNAHELIPRSRLQLVEGAAHNAYYQNRHELISCIDGLLQE